jgi:hypothetical protein
MIRRLGFGIVWAAAVSCSQTGDWRGVNPVDYVGSVPFRANSDPGGSGLVLTTDPSQLSVASGGSAIVKLTVAGSGFSGTAVIEVVGWRALIFATLVPTGTGTAELQITTDTALTPLGLTQLVVRASTGPAADGGMSLSTTATILLNVTPPETPDYELHAHPYEHSMITRPGDVATATVTTHPLGGWSAPVDVTYSGLPPGATATFRSQLEARDISNLAIQLAADTPAGSYPLTITATSAGVVRTVNWSVLVALDTGPRLDITVEPAYAAAVAPGETAQLTVHTAARGAWSGDVLLSYTGPVIIGVDVHGAFTPERVPAGDSSTLTLTAGSATRGYDLPLIVASPVPSDGSSVQQVFVNLGVEVVAP